MTKMAKGQARMCSRTYRGRWPSGFSQSTCPLPKVLSYETPRAGNGPRGLSRSCCCIGFSQTHTKFTWRLFLARPRSCLLPQLLSNKQFQLPCVPVEKQRTCHWSDGSGAQCAKVNMGQPSQAHRKAPLGRSNTRRRDHRPVDGLRTKGRLGCWLRAGERNWSDPDERRVPMKDLRHCSSGRVSHGSEFARLLPIAKK